MLPPWNSELDLVLRKLNGELSLANVIEGCIVQSRRTLVCRKLYTRRIVNGTVQARTNWPLARINKQRTEEIFLRKPHVYFWKKTEGKAKDLVFSWFTPDKEYCFAAVSSFQDSRQNINASSAGVVTVDASSDALERLCGQRNEVFGRTVHSDTPWSIMWTLCFITASTGSTYRFQRASPSNINSPAVGVGLYTY